jgi:hypothetical protein
VKRLALLAVVLVAAACGGAKTFHADKVRTCVPRGAYQRVFVTHEEGVTSLNYAYADGSEADVSVFESVHDAEEAEKQEARLGDAHDRRRANVLYSGGGPVQAALEKCLR